MCGTAGIASGSWTWSIGAALGLSALMLANAWVFEALRYIGAGYLLFLAFKSVRAALTPGRVPLRTVSAASYGAACGKGLAMHVTNPKAILFFGALYSVGVPPSAAPLEVAMVVAAVGVQSVMIFALYALLFSNRRVVTVYMRLRRWFEATFAFAFGYAGIRLLTARLG